MRVKIMFHLTIDGKNISFSFDHVRDVNLVLPLRMNPKKLVTITDVTLCDLLIDGKQFQGESCCTLGDKFVKETGRKVALTRALSETELGREERRLVWGKYFSRGER
jgi:hypothetical protein